MSRPCLVLDGRVTYLVPYPAPLLASTRKSPLLLRFKSPRCHPVRSCPPREVSSQSTAARAAAPPLARDFKYAHHIFKPTENGGESRGHSLPSPKASPTQVRHEKVTQLEERTSRESEPRPLPYVIKGLKQLVGKYMKEPSAEYYKTWILATCDPLHGSATMLWEIWEEIAREKVAVGSETFHAFIKALASHPDLLLRAMVLERMEQRWISLSPEGWNDLIVGLLRETQLAMVMEKLQEMRDKGISVQDWVYVATIHSLVDHAEYIEALDLIDILMQGEVVTIPLNTWHHLLDSASQEYSYEATVAVWEKMVEPGFLIPSSGMCNNVLVTATRRNDPALASKVFRILGQRKDMASLEICEPLFDIFIAANDVHGGFRLLCSMKENGLEVSERMLRPLVEYYNRATTLDNNPLQILEEIVETRSTMRSQVPIEALNVIMELRLKSSDPQSVKAIFEDLEILYSVEPNPRTFQLLFHACRQIRDLDSAIRYFDAIRPSSQALTDERVFILLVSACLDVHDFNQAASFLLAAQETGKVTFHMQTIDSWTSSTSEMARPHSKALDAFIKKLEHIRNGQEIRKEIEGLKSASEEINPFEAAREAAEKTTQQDKIKQARLAYGLRKWFKTRETRVPPSQQKANADEELESLGQEQMQHDVHGMFETATEGSRGFQISSPSASPLQHPSHDPRAAHQGAQTHRRPDRPNPRSFHQPYTRSPVKGKAAKPYTIVGGLEDLVAAMAEKKPK